MEASELLDRGQGTAFVEALREASAERGRLPDDATLEAALAEQAEDGLRFVAIVAPSGRILARAGHPLAPLGSIVATEGLDLTRVGSRVRLVLSPASHRRHARARRARWPRLRDAAGPPAIVVEFEPVASNRLRTDARRTVLTSSAGAALLLVAAVGLWQRTRREDQDRVRAERDRRLALLGEMSAVLAHEIRNPLASLKGHAQLLVEQTEPDSRQRKKAERVVTEAERIERLSATLLDFVKSGTIKREQVSPLAVLEASADSVGRDRIDIRAEGAPASFALDPVRMGQVFTNLLQNAVQASPDERKVEATVAGNSSRLVLTVRDHGGGLPPGQEQEIFEAFKTHRTQGTGLGLAIAKRIVEMHDGTLEAANAEGGGALFRVEIPE